MPHRVKAVYHGGAFVPQEPCDIPEDAEVELIVHGPFVVPPAVHEAEERRQILRAVVANMRQNPMPTGVPCLTRDALHERR